jgi:hypothetical protein
MTAERVSEHWQKLANKLPAPPKPVRTASRARPAKR